MLEYQISGHSAIAIFYIGLLPWNLPKIFKNIFYNFLCPKYVVLMSWCH